MIRIFLIFGIFLMLFSGCELFTTRNPENPNQDKSLNQPATSPNIVISNLKNSILEKNADNYLACLSQISSGDIKDFVFIPSSEALTQYKVKFDNWNINSERSAFFSTIALDQQQKPEFSINIEDVPTNSPDSVIYYGNYYLSLDYTNLKEKVSGKFRFTIVPRQGGFWSIQRWEDYKTPGDTINKTWSILKAVYGN